MTFNNFRAPCTTRGSRRGGWQLGGVWGDRRRGGGSGAAAMAMATRRQRQGACVNRIADATAAPATATTTTTTTTTKITTRRPISKCTDGRANIAECAQFDARGHTTTYTRIRGSGMPRSAARPQCSKSRHDARIAPLRRARAREVHTTTTATTTTHQQRRQQQQQRRQRRDHEVASPKRVLLTGVFRASSSSLHLHQPSSLFLSPLYYLSAVDGGPRAYARRRRHRG